ncbi:MAG: alpha/beta hydrolase [Alphaproteobacteria bacterium]|nr:alpha/beta hydrolase [Alphaproteobacteria bacterium]
MLLIVFAVAATAACAPRVQPSGPFSAAPRIDGDTFVARDGVRLPMRAWTPEGPPRAVVTALHGFNDYSLAFERPAEAWAREGIATYAYDQRGFGAGPEPGIWAGTEAMTDDLASFAGVLAKRYPGVPLYLAGDSMGAAVVLAALARRPDLRPAGALLIAPAVWGWDHLGPFKSTMLWLTAHTVPWFQATAEGLDVTPSDNEEMLRRLARDPLIIKSTRMDSIWGLVNLMDTALAATARVDVPVLLLYGTRDEIIPEEPTRLAIARLLRNGKARAAFYDSGYHMLLRDLNAAVPIADAAAWFLDPRAPLPSGADRRAPGAARAMKAPARYPPPGFLPDWAPTPSRRLSDPPASTACPPAP